MDTKELVGITVRQDLFNRFMLLKFGIQAMASVIQNDDTTLSQEEPDEWNEICDDFNKKFQKLIDDVNSFYSIKNGSHNQ